MQLFALGLNHHTAPVSIREQVAFQPERLVQALGDLVRAKSVKEAAILSTCNRTELYFATEQPQDAADWFAEYHRVALHDLSPYLYTFPQRDAVRHVFRVASGLDSMVIGEPQILGQVKDAVRQAEQATDAELVTVLAPAICAHVKPGGQLALAGILPPQIERITDAYAPWIAMTVTAERDGWVRMSGTRAP